MNEGIEPNSFYITKNTATCSWDRGEPGYWGTTGHAYLRCPNGQPISDDGNYCSLPMPTECDKGCNSLKAGNPINIPSGAKTHAETDFVVGRGRLRFIRYYNSLAYEDDNGLARKWSTNFHPRIRGTYMWYGGEFAITEPNGEILRMYKDGRRGWGMSGLPWNATNGWTGKERHQRKDRLGYVMTEVSPTQLTLRNPDGMERDFQYTEEGSNDAIMTRIRYPDGYRIDFTYNANRVLQSVTDTDGYTISFGYNARGLLTSVTAPDGEVYKIEYEELPGSAWAHNLQGDLKNVWQYYSIMSAIVFPDDTPNDDTDNPRRTYNYDHPQFDTALTSIIDERGITTRTWDYAWHANYGWRAISSVGPQGRELTTISREVPRTQFKVTNALGKETLYNFAQKDGVPKLISVDGLAGANTAASSKDIVYDSLARMTSRTDAEGQVTTYSIDFDSGLPTTIVEASGAAAQETTNITWDTALRKPTVVNAPGLRTEYTYDSGWNLTQMKQTDTTSHTTPYSTNGQMRVWNYSWSTDGLLTSIDGPLASTTDQISFTYDTNGNLASMTDAVGLVTTVNSVDGMGRPTQITEPNGLVTTMDYTERGWIERVPNRTARRLGSPILPMTRPAT